MRSWQRLLVGLCVFGGVVGAAQGQEALDEGPGVKIGDGLVLHPGVSLEFLVDSNVFFADGDDVSPRISAPLLRVRGGLALATLPPQRLGNSASAPRAVDFRLGLAAAYREYFSDNEAVKEQRTVEAESGLRLTLFPNAPVSFGVFDDYARLSRPPNQEDTANWVRDYNRGGATLMLRPGGGALELDLRYTNEVEYWENHLLDTFTAHTGDLRLMWRALPKTAFVLEASQGFAQRGDIHPKSRPLRVLAGLLGQITYRTAAVLRFGYANGFYDSLTFAGGQKVESNYNNVLGQAELSWKPNDAGLLTLGFRHDFRDSVWAFYYVDEHAYLKYNQLIAGRLSLRVGGGYRYRDFHGAPDGANIDLARTQAENGGRLEPKAHVAEAEAGIDYRLRDGFLIGASYNLDVLATDFAVVYTNGVRDPWGWVKHQAMARLAISY